MLGCSEGDGVGSSCTHTQLQDVGEARKEREDVGEARKESAAVSETACESKRRREARETSEKTLRK